MTFPTDAAPGDRPTHPRHGQGPGLWWYLTEPSRALVEFGRYATGRSSLHTAPRGDGHPVLVLPGLLASDRSTLPLRRFLARLGYPVFGWRMGTNIGPTRTVLRGMRALLAHTAAAHDTRVSLIGWSLGGIFARELTREHPELVRDVITLGSPYRLRLPRETHAHRVYRWLSRLHVPPSELPGPEHFWTPLPVPATSVYSTSDGIVAWHTCVEEPGPLRENVAVVGSHLGYGHNTAVLWLIADRLAQPEGDWQPFRPPPELARLYPPVDPGPAAAG
jgi:pimeloyl-ACP methyl ester carboxylesterase